MKVLAVLAVVLMVGVVYAQQQSGQSAQQQQSWSARSGPGMGATGGSDYVRLSQMATQNNADLRRSIQTAEQQAKGKTLGAAFMQHTQAGATAGESGASAGQSQQLVAHVYVLADNQIKDVIVDAKNNRVISSDNRQMLMNPWQMNGMGSSLGQSGSQGQSGMSGSTGQSGSQGQSGMQDRTGTGGTQSLQAQTGALTLTTAQQLVRLADQDNITIEKALQTAEQQARGGKVIGVFLVLPSHAGPAVQQQQQQTGGQQEQASVFVKAYVVDQNQQLKEFIIDAKNEKVITQESRQMLMSPWQAGRTAGQQPGMGGTTGQQQYQDSSQYRSGQQRDSGERFPTGSGSGTGPGSLGGSSD
jgi:hypothetical protein